MGLMVSQVDTGDTITVMANLLITRMEVNTVGPTDLPAWLEKKADMMRAALLFHAKQALTTRGWAEFHNS
jgi:hypothetical protein